MVCFSENLQFIPRFCSVNKSHVTCALLLVIQSIIIIVGGFFKPETLDMNRLTLKSNWRWNRRIKFVNFYRPRKLELKVRGALRIVLKTFLYLEFVGRLFKYRDSCQLWTIRFSGPAGSSWLALDWLFSNFRKACYLVPDSAGPDLSRLQIGLARSGWSPSGTFLKIITRIHSYLKDLKLSLK